jgi:IMP dehydrogenase/GMP reductase
MFDSLKKKISSWFKEDEKPTKGKKKTAKAKKEKVPKDKKPKIKKASQKKSKKEIILPIQIDPLLQTPQVDTEKLQELEAEVEARKAELVSISQQVGERLNAANDPALHQTEKYLVS